MRRKTTSLLQENYKILKESDNCIIRILVLSYNIIARLEEDIGNNRIRSV